MDEQQHISRNVQEVEKYLKEQFLGFTLIARQDKPLKYTFTVEDRRQLFKLVVPWTTLSDKSSIPDKIRHALQSQNAAARMREKGEEGYNLE